MRKPDKKPSMSIDTSDTSRITTTEKSALIKDVYDMCMTLEYVNPHVFEKVVHHILKAFLIGKKEKPDSRRVQRLISKLVHFTRRTSSEKPEIEWFSRYASEVNRAVAEARPSGENFFRDLAKVIFPQLCIELPDFGHLLTSDQGEEVVLTSLNGFVFMLPGTDAVRSFGLNVLSGVDQIERARSTIPNMALPDGLEQELLAEIEQQRIANAWLMPPKDTDKE